MEPRERIDALLDLALRNYGGAEPRIGLEGRVLAQLEAEQAKPASRVWWLKTAAAVAVLAFGVVLLVSLRPEHAPNPPATAATRTHPPLVRDARAGVASSRTPKPVASHHAAGGSIHLAETEVIGKAPAKRDQFPTPTPLSDQEQMLAFYVHQFHREARLMARAQTRLLEEETRERALPVTRRETSEVPPDEQP